MNRIILVGNGFDLAHGLRTSYSHFINNYWQKKLRIFIENYSGKRYEDEDLKVKYIPNGVSPFSSNFQEIQSDFFNFNRTKIEFKNIFLDLITQHNTINNWVDIENSYYKILTDTFAKDIRNKPYQNKIKNLNEDFKKIQNYLSEYLMKEFERFEKEVDQDDLMSRIGKIGSIIYSKYKLKDLSEISANNRIKEEYEKIEKLIKSISSGEKNVNSLSQNELVLYENFSGELNFSKFREFITTDYTSRFLDLFPKKTLIVNFNYTPTTNYYLYNNSFNYPGYVKVNKTEIVHIHGSLIPKEKNPIIFGYGDELDDNYKEIEKLGDDYLEYIKSIKYLETDNYKRLLEFINSDDYQVFIMGHSCGTSDRTMLNTIFEHDNCSSIKSYYHKVKENNYDNFSSIIKNISRNFNDKAIMRDRVVNKQYCEPLL